jgi:hypothetical protein
LQGIKLGYDLGLGLTADYILANENIKDIEGSILLYWYIGIGARMSIGLGAGLGVRYKF